MAHNYYQEAGGESLVFEQELELLRQRGYALAEYTRDSRDILHFNLWQRAAFFANALYSCRTDKAIKQLVRQVQPDVALVQNVFPLISPSIYRSLAALDVPIVQLVFNYRFVCPNAHLYTQGAICERCVRSRTYWHAARYRCFRDSRVLSTLYALILATHRAAGTFDRISAFVVPDQTLKAKMIEGGFAADTIHINAYPFNVAQIEPIYRYEEHVVFVGRFIPQKGVETLVRAMALVKSPIRLVIVGGGPQERLIDSLIHELGLTNVQVAGPLWGEALAQVLRHCQAVIVPSEWYDNTPRIVYEAFAWGKPVVGSRIPGIVDAVTDGETGLLFRPGEPADLAEKIDRLATDTDLAFTLGRNARRIAETDYGVERHLSILVGIIQQVAQTRSTALHV